MTQFPAIGDWDRSVASPPGAGDRVVWITGAGGGLGGALVRGFHEAGWRVAAAGHREAPNVASERVWACALDVTQGAACERVVAEILDRWGRVDLLIHNAGVAADRLVAGMADDDWDRVLDVHLKGAFLCSRAVLPAMTRQADGQIVNVGSFAGKGGPIGQANYAAAKAGLIGLTLSLAREVAASGIRVNAVLPGVLPTRMTAGLKEPVRQALVAANLMQRMNTLDEVVRLFLGLAEARNVSGQVIQWDSRIARWV